MPTRAAHTLSERDFARIASSVRYLAEHRLQRPTLTQVAAQAGLSPFHFNRLFRRWAGVTPKQYLEVLDANTAMQSLRRGDSVLDAALETGLSGPGRLHDLLVTLEAATPGAVRQRGAGLEIRWGVADSVFGSLSVGETDRGLCHVAFGATRTREPPEALVERWPRATFVHDDSVAQRVADLLARAGRAGGDAAQEPLRLYVAGTNFQLRVWRALLELGGDETTSYGELAAAIRAPRAARAVGTAVGANPVAWLIPCHRVLRENGALGGYRWGVDRKRAILAWESLRQV